ncbi:MAG TPA: HD domain-containing phosphohydrolase, partial [Thermoanaerobaculia bacterium]|nr:HD domain-containing phosphohydrolase [Thermoanaerobaculia bacterium]
MLPEIKAIETQLKQILYGCVEHVQATKAALYLSASADLNERTYEIVTSYQFSDPERKVVKENDEIVDRLSVKRSAFFINGLGTDHRFSEMLFRQGTDRLLAMPLFARGRLLGFIDMRDKAGKKPFDTPDLDAAKKIADEMLAFLGSRNLYGIGKIPLVPDPTQKSLPQTLTVSAAPEAAPAAHREPRPAQSAAAAIAAARELMSKKQLTPSGVGRRTVTEQDVDVFRLLLPSALSVPGAVVAAITAVGVAGNPRAIASVASIADNAMEMLNQHVEDLLKRANQPHMLARPPVVYPFGVQAVPVSGSSITAIVSAQVPMQTIEGLMLTLVFERTGESQAHRALQVFLKQMEHSFDAAMSASAGRGDRQLIAEKLLEPDFEKHPDLVNHSREVAGIASRLATLLELPPSQVETVRIAALVHDVGFRLLGYDRFFRRNLNPEDQRDMIEHPTVGAALVEPLLGPDVAQAVLRHHERVDGTGYP